MLFVGGSKSLKIYIRQYLFYFKNFDRFSSFRISIVIFAILKTITKRSKNLFFRIMNDIKI
jgi:hypothetical protein